MPWLPKIVLLGDVDFEVAVVFHCQQYYRAGLFPQKGERKELQVRLGAFDGLSIHKPTKEIQEKAWEHLF